MMGKLDSFKFEMTKKEFDSISHKFTWIWAESQRIGNHPKHQAVGKVKEVLTFTGTWILQKVTSMDELIAIANRQEPVTLSFVNGSFKVVVHSIEMNKDTFIRSGKFFKLRFSISLSRWYK